ncbi:MAG: TetR/AcrR family transcriptional regulator [Nocardioides sp.]
MPRLWTDTIDEHRRQVRDAILDAMADLAATGGVLSVTMSHVADHAGIGRKTLYKYYPDLASILSAWHERRVAHHLAGLRRTADDHADPHRRLQAVLRAHAAMIHQHHSTALSHHLAGAPHVTGAHGQIRAFLADVVVSAANAGGVRRDIKPVEIADYLLHALGAAATAVSKAAVERLVQLTLDAIGEPGEAPTARYRSSAIR